METDMNCSGCGRRFHSIRAMEQHTCIKCPVCEKSFAKPSSLRRHTKVCAGALIDNTGHQGIESMDITRYPIIVDRRSPFDDFETDQLDEGLVDVIQRNWSSIMSRHKCQKMVDILNVRLWEPTETAYEANVEDNVAGVWNELPCLAKVNASVGAILVHKTSGEYRYFHSSSNNATIKDRPVLVKTTEDATTFVNNIMEEEDLRWIGLRQRPNTEWRLHTLTNMTVYFYKLLGMGKVGAGKRRGDRSYLLPRHIWDSKNILAMESNSVTGKRYNDNDCFFRCLSVLLECHCHKGKCKCNRVSERRAKELKRKYLRSTGTDINNFSGVDEKDLIRLEEIFDVVIIVFNLKRNGSSQLLWRSGRQYQKKLYLNQEGSHFSYIKNIDAYANSFSCETCEACFTRASHLNRHQCSVEDVTKINFQGGSFKRKTNVFDKLLEELTIFVPEEDRFFPYRITFDIEAMLAKTDLPEPTDTLAYESRHEFLSVSVCSNVPTYTEPRCFVRRDGIDECISEFVQYMLEIAITAELLMTTRYETVFDELQEKCRKREEKEEKFSKSRFSNPRTYESRKNYGNVEEELKAFARCVPVVGFNSQKYDLNVIKGPLMKHLLKEEGEFEFVVKKGDALSCVQTARLRFLDATNFIAPGYTYAAYLKAYGVKEGKGFFPYEWMDSLDKLDVTELPPREAFYSKLKGSAISEEDYAVCINAWTDKEMTTMRDFLIWYNNLDVEPFLEALHKQCEIYKDRGIDMLKAAISLPGLAVDWLFTTCDETPSIKDVFEINRQDGKNVFRSISEALIDTRDVHLIDEDNSDIYQTIKDNLVGGPSIVYHRYHEKDVTKIRPEQFGETAADVKLITGLDANALYLMCLMGDLPVGAPIRRLCENGFVAERVAGKTAQGWLAWIEFSMGEKLETALSGGERRLGRHNLPVDGFCFVTDTVYQFHGCYWHGHGCSRDSSKDIGNKTAEERKYETLEKQKYLESLGYEVVVKWECDWTKEVASSNHIKLFLKAFFATIYGDRTKRLSENDVLSRVMEGKMFGFVECDIRVPDHLEHFFTDNPPIFKNIELSRSDLSEHMRSFAEERGHLKSSQRCLIGSMKGQKILLFSELLAWYLKHGLIVTMIHQVIEYKGKAIYKKFADSVTEARRAGDVDPSKALIASTAKLVGNSLYGKTITDQTRHRNVDYSTDRKKVSARVRSNRFYSLNELDEDVYETTLFKKSICMNVPVILGFTILQRAKLRMLEFYYDCLDRFIPRMYYQQMSTDTDSNYCALAGPLATLIKPGLVDRFFEEFDEWFVAPCCELHASSYRNALLSDSYWKQDECCRRAFKYNSRTPGLFKEEFEGSGMVALNSKTYICWKDDDDLDKEDIAAGIPTPLNSTDPSSATAKREQRRVKLSSKGLSKRTNKLSRQQYMDVLTSGVPVKGQNTGFLRRNNITYTYTQEKTGLTYFYGKRKVMADGISTTHLDI